MHDLPINKEPPLYSRCVYCGKAIYNGDVYYEIAREDYCQTCVEKGFRIADVE